MTKASMPDLRELHPDSANNDGDPRSQEKGERRTRIYDTRNERKDGSDKNGTRSGESERFTSARKASCATACQQGQVKVTTSIWRLKPAGLDKAASNRGLYLSLEVSATPLPGVFGGRYSDMGNLLESGQEGWRALFGALKDFYPAEMAATTTTVSYDSYRVCFMRLASLSWFSMISPSPNIFFPRVLNAFAYVITYTDASPGWLSKLISNASIDQHSLLGVELGVAHLQSIQASCALGRGTRSCRSL